MMYLAIMDTPRTLEAYESGDQKFMSVIQYRAHR
jgi:hypothetical protein